MGHKSPSPLRLARFERRLTQWQLAQRANISASKLSLIERFEVQPTSAERERLAASLGVPEVELFGPAASESAADPDSSGTAPTGTADPHEEGGP
jgi:transcriptional regulator with XRE-family HTH domain